MAQRLLMRLANPNGTNYRIGIINTAAEFGALISPQGASPTAESVSGYSSTRGSGWQLSWTARELLEASADHVTFEVRRTRVDPQGCPALEEEIERFYGELDSVLREPISLSALPIPPVFPNGIEEVTLDGTSFIIQIWTNERILAIYPDRDVDRSLDRASGALLGVIGGCVDGLPSTVEEHIGW